MKQKKIITAIIIIVIIITLIGCESEKEGKVDPAESFYTSNNKDIDADIDTHIEYEPAHGGELILPLTMLETLNPLISENRSYYHFSKLIFEGLFQLDNDLNIENQLAEDYAISQDGNIISVKLREDALWHDGVSLTSDDVAFTIETIKRGNDDGAYKRIFDNVLGTYNPSEINRIMDVEIIDKYNLNIIFNGSFSNGLEVLTFPVVARHSFLSESKAEATYTNALEEDYIPIGTGPYKFVDYEKYKAINLESNSDYRDGKPYIDKIIGKIIDDSEFALMAFELGDINATIIEDVDWEKYDQNNKIRIYEFVSQNYDFLGFNFDKKIFTNEESKFLRKAINYGIDRQEIIKSVYFGHGTQVDLPIHPNSWLFSEEVNVYGYNPSKAIEEIERLGWKDFNGNGFYEDENGREVSLRLITNSYNPLRLKVADMIASDLEKIGIRIIKDYSEYIPDNITEEIVEDQWQEVNAKIARSDYDIALLGWNLPEVGDLNFAFHSSQIKSASNIIRYNNESMDERLLEAFSAPHRDEKLKAYLNLQKIIIEELPYISLYFKNNALLVDEKIMGDIRPSFHNFYRNIENWYIPKEFQKE